MTSFILIKIKVIWGRVGELPWYKPHPHAWLFKYSYEIKGKNPSLLWQLHLIKEKERKKKQQTTNLTSGFTIMQIAFI